MDKKQSRCLPIGQQILWLPFETQETLYLFLLQVKAAKCALLYICTNALYNKCTLCTVVAVLIIIFNFTKFLLICSCLLSKPSFLQWNLSVIVTFRSEFLGLVAALDRCIIVFREFLDGLSRQVVFLYRFLLRNFHCNSPSQVLILLRYNWLTSTLWRSITA